MRRRILRKAPALRNNNGALQIRVRLEGKDYFINRLGRFDDPVAQAKAQSISAEIWSDFQQGQLDWSLSRYQPLVEGKDPELLDALRVLMEEKRQGRTTHAYRLVRRYGEPIRTQAEVEGFVEWMRSEGLAASTQSTILSTIRSVQPKNKVLGSVVIKVPILYSACRIILNCLIVVAPKHCNYKKLAKMYFLLAAWVHCCIMILVGILVYT